MTVDTPKLIEMSTSMTTSRCGGLSTIFLFIGVIRSHVPLNLQRTIKKSRNPLLYIKIRSLQMGWTQTNEEWGFNVPKRQCDPD